MNDEVSTPIQQAMREGVLSRQTLKSLMARSDRPALGRLAGCFVAGSHLIGNLGCVWQLVDLSRDVRSRHRHRAFVFASA